MGIDLNFGHTFCRNYLKLVMADVKKHVSLEIRKAAWTYNYGRCKEFQINKVGDMPQNFYWHGRACCCWEARTKGWTAYLEHTGVYSRD